MGETSHIEQALGGLIKLQSTQENAPDYLDGSRWKLMVEQEFFQAPITTWDVHAVRNLLAPKQKREIDWTSDHSCCAVHNGKHNNIHSIIWLGWFWVQLSARGWFIPWIEQDNLKKKKKKKYDCWGQRFLLSRTKKNWNFRQFLKDIRMTVRLLAPILDKFSDLKKKK